MRGEGQVAGTPSAARWIAARSSLPIVSIAAMARAARSFVGVGKQVLHAMRDHLPGQPEAVLEPAARSLRAAVGQPRPEVVDLVLVRAVDPQRHGLVEREVGATV